MQLTEFLLACIAEDEEWARWAGSAQDAERSRGLAFVSSMETSSVTSSGRVLAECGAKRRIVDWAAPLVSGVRHENEDGRDLLKILALPYADHPDYRDEWKP